MLDMKHGYVALLGSALCLGAFGATPESACTDYLETSDTSYDRSSLLFGDNWHSGNAPSLGSTNYVASGKKILGPKSASLSANPFHGDCFVVAGSLSMYNGVINWKDLRLQNGSSYTWSSASAINGLVRVESTAENPAAIKSFFGNSFMAWNLNAEFVGDKDSVLKLQRSSDGPPKFQSPDSYYYVLNNWDNFLGTVRVATNTAIGVLSTSGNGNRRIAGKVEVETGGYWYGLACYGFPGSVYVTLGSLEMKDGSHFWAHPDADGRASLVVVTNRLVLGNNVTLTFKNSWSATGGNDSTPPAYTAGGESKFQLFKLMGAATESIPNLTGVNIPDFPESQKIGGLLPRHKELSCRDNSDGTKTIWVVYRDKADWTMNRANTAQGGWKDCAFHPTNTFYWVDESVPSSDSVGTAWITQAMEIQGANNSDGFDFENVTFMLNGSLYMYAAYLNVSNLVVLPGKVMYVHRGATTKYLRGRMTVLGGFELYNYAGATVHIDSELLGSGTLNLKEADNANPAATFYLGGTSSNFHGKIVSATTFYSSARGAFPNPEKNWFATLYLNDGRNFGGSYSKADSYAATTLGAWTKLKIVPSVSSVTLDEPTRGILITNDCLQVDLSAGQTLTVKEPITFGGQLRKLGGGCLALGGAARFIDGDPATEPAEGTNRLVVAAGTLKILSTNAVDGVQIELESGAELAVDANSESDGMAEFGFVNTRWATPFVTNGDPIRVRVCGIGENEEAAVPICTVTSTVAEDLDIRLLRIQGHRGSVTQRPNPDGTVTFVANIEPTGVIMLIR